MSFWNDDRDQRGSLSVAKAASKLAAILLAHIESLKLIKGIGPAVSMSTMVLDAIAFTFYFGLFSFAIGITFATFVHESGHWTAARLKGLQPSWMVFIPIVGAYVTIRGVDERDRDEAAFLSFGGPLAGGLVAFGYLCLWLTLPGEHQILLILVVVTATINLLNMFPLRPFDGGAIGAAISEYFKCLGLLLLLGLSWLVWDSWILLIWILVLPDFDVIHEKILVIICGSLMVLMATLMLLGHSQQPLFVDIIDNVIAAFSIVV